MARSSLKYEMSANGEIMLRGIVFLTLSLMVISPTLAIAQQGYGQFSLNNQSSETADLYVSGAYGCRALARLFCTTQARIGTHTLVARWTNGKSFTIKDVELLQGAVRTMTIKDTYR
jgi:hypothetical protein